MRWVRQQAALFHQFNGENYKLLRWRLTIKYVIIKFHRKDLLLATAAAVHSHHFQV